jgi:integrase
MGHGETEPMGKPNQLSAKFVEAVKTPGLYRDGLGLLLRVEPTGAKRWVLRTPVNGKRRDLGLGAVRDLTLAQARDKAADMRKAARDGRDPTAERKGSLTFAEAAKQAHAQRSKGFSNGKHNAQWITTLETYAFPTMGKKLVSDIEPADVLKVLSPIWLEIPETARRVRQRIGVVLDWASTEGYRPAHLVNAAQPVTKALPKQPRRKKHHPAVPWRDAPKFLVKVRECPSTDAVRYALEFLLLTAARTKEVRLATWSEIDLEAACWTRPAAHMKAKVPHRVPLSAQAVQLLREVRARWPNCRLVFPGRYGKEPLTDMAMLMLMRRLKWLDGHGNGCVPHGLRSTFRDWGGDNRHDRDLLEAQLAHELENDTESAYARSDLFDQRKPVMHAWADFCCGPVKGGDNAAE